MVRARSGSERIGSPASCGSLEGRGHEQSRQTARQPARPARQNHPDASRRDRRDGLLAEPIATVGTVPHGRCAPHRFAGSGELPHAGTLVCWRQNKLDRRSAGQDRTDGTAEPAGRSEHTSASARHPARTRRFHDPTALRSMCSCCPPSSSAHMQGRHECEQVLAAGRLGSQASQCYAWLPSQSVCTWLAASRVRFAGLRPPLTQPTT